MRLVLAFVLCLIAAWPAAAQRRYETYTGFTVPTTVALPTTETHPSLYFRAEDVGDATTGLRARRNRARASPTDPIVGADWAQIDREQAAFKRKSVSATSINERPRYAKSLAFRFLIANDAVARDSAIAALVRMYEGVPQRGDSATFARPYMPIFRATWLQNYCAAYDWLDGVLTPAQRDTVRARLGREAELLRRHMVEGVAYAPKPQNFRLKAAYALGTAALTLSSDPRAVDWLRVALEQQNSVTRYQFSADGVYREGPHYLVYVLVNGLPFLRQMQSVAGADLFPHYAPVFEAAVRLRGTQGWWPPFEDGAPKPIPAHLAAPAYRARPTDLHPTAPLAEVLQWHWRTTALPKRDYTGATVDVTWELDSFLLADDQIAATAPTASPVQRLDAGAVALRTAWTGADARTLVVQAIPEGDNHQHPDRLGYHLDAFGTVLAPDAGYGPAGAADPKKAWYTSVEAHNTVAVGGGPTVATDAMRNDDNAGQAIEAFVAAPWGTAYAALSARDAGVPGSGRLRRGVLMHGGVYVVADGAEGTSEADYTLLVHGRGPLAGGGTVHRWSVPADAYGPAADLAVALAGGEAPVTASGWTNLAWGHEEAQTYLRAPQRAVAPAYLHALVPLASTAATPALAATADGDQRRVTLGRGGATLSVASRTATGSLDAGDGTTATGRMAWSERTTGGTILEVGGDGVTGLHDGARPLLATAAPVAVAWRRTGTGEETFVVDRPATLDLWPLDPAHGIARLTDASGSDVAVERLPAGGVRVTLAAGTVRLATGPGVASEAPSLPPGLGLRVGPSPSAGAVTLFVRLPPGAREAAVIVRDALGRVVWRTTATGPLVWEGHGDGGPLAPGIYVVEARVGSESVRQTLVRLR